VSNQEYLNLKAYFLVNVNSRSRSLYVVVRLSFMSSVVCLSVLVDWCSQSRTHCCTV